MVLGLPRGGVPVAYEVARGLGAPLDVLLVRKLGVPGHEELAMGAIASGGVQVLNEDVVVAHRLSADTVAAVAGTEAEELARRERAYRGDRPPPVLRGRTVVVVDDGLATGASMRAAVEVVQRQEPAAVVVAVPVGAPATLADLAARVDEAVAVHTPEGFGAVGLWYDDFSPTTDQEVARLLAEATS